MPIWPMPKSYTRGNTTITIDYYNFHFIPNKQHSDITAAINRYMDEIFGGNIAAPARFSSLTTVYIDIEDYDVQLNVFIFFILIDSSSVWTRVTP